MILMWDKVPWDLFLQRKTNAMGLSVFLSLLIVYLFDQLDRAASMHAYIRGEWLLGRVYSSTNPDVHHKTDRSIFYLYD